MAYWGPHFAYVAPSLADRKSWGLFVNHAFKQTALFQVHEESLIQSVCLVALLSDDCQQQIQKCKIRTVELAATCVLVMLNASDPDMDDAKFRAYQNSVVNICGVSFEAMGVMVDLATDILNFCWHADI